MTESAFYSDRAGLGKARVSETVSAEAWAGLTALIQQRIDDGSLARAFPLYTCPDDPGRNTVTGTDEEKFLRSLTAHVPDLVAPLVAPDPGHDGEPAVTASGWPSGESHVAQPSRSPLDPGKVPATATALDLIDFVALHIDQPTSRSSHNWNFDHTHYSFHQPDYFYDTELTPGQVQLRHDIDLLFARNGIAYTVGDDMRVRRLGPPEALPLISDFRPSTGDPQLDSKLKDAMERFLSRDSVDRQDALEKLWDAFERLKTLELGGGTLKKASVSQLLTLASSGSVPFRELLDAEFKTLTRIGNDFTIRHHEHDKEDVPTDAAIDYLFMRLVSAISLVLRHTGRMAS
ncbi:hypothetical protein [Streptomyces sp. HUAS CX7]|uniref:hypothetical protein n=1 Tax=Streptomyces sp. HUAS CX7 TaxID=3062782 RepID=UPI0026F375D7|nr:hypothetical protein [Streptomyces sp. HUAS CX7]WKX19346.1 hypothetical protein Q3Y68_15350 [Streptomyces sp. HUAS CX7]